MADNITVDNGGLTDYIVSADEVAPATGRVVQRMKLCYSADGDETHIGADANGLDVDVVRLPALPAGTNNIGDVDVLTLPALPAGTNNIGDVDIVSVPTLTKGTQGATGLSTQDLKDAGRNHVAYHMAAQVAASVTDALVSLTGWKGNAAVAATTTPAVVTAGKTLRLTALHLTCIATATAGTVVVTLRANTGGLVAITSPVVARWAIGAPAAVAGVAFSEVIPFEDGFEFPAGTGLGISIQGFGPTGTASGNDWFQMAMHGFEY